MKYSYFRLFVWHLLLFGIITQSFRPADHTLHGIKKVVLAVDFDGVVAQFDIINWIRLFIRYPHRIAQLWCNKEFRTDVYQSKKGGLCDKNNNAIVGDIALVDYLMSTYMPWATDQDKQCAYAVVTGVYPINEVIDLIQSYEIPAIVWTNNDQSAYNVKLKTINEQRVRAGYLPFEPQLACTIIAVDNENGQQIISAKPDVEYYKRAYEEACKHFNLQSGELLILFIDDNFKNIVGAQNAIEHYNIPIKAFYYSGSSKNLERELVPYVYQSTTSTT